MNTLINQETLFTLFPNGKIRILPKKTVIATPHQKVTSIYWLLEGSIDHYVSLDKPKKNVLVNKTAEPMTCIGWNGLNAPGRFYHATVVGSKEAELYEVPMDQIEQYLDSNPDSAFLRDIGQRIYYQFGQALSRQIKQMEHEHLPTAPSTLEPYVISPEPDTEEMITLMRRSPFMEAFEDEDLRELAGHTVRREYEPGEEIYHQREPTPGFYILIQGEVTIERHQEGVRFKHRTLSTPGFVFGWSCPLEMPDVCNAMATHKCSVYMIPTEQLRAILKAKPALGIRFHRRLIWLLGNHLQASFARSVYLSIHHDQLTIHNLIEGHKSKLQLSSPIYQVPHLLKEYVTKPIAYDILHQLNQKGNAAEKFIASISLQLLRHDEKELKFMQGLNRIYESVTENAETDPEALRKACSASTRQLFEPLEVKISGWEQLPKSAGHIFIYNHLLNDPNYTLPNGFQITLDSHFISSLILDATYNSPGIRTVRMSKGPEYGHQDYYERLGYINVFTQDSDNAPARREQAKKIFYEQATAHLKAGENVIISPEGTSYASEESPGPFKMGAFNLAYQNPEVCIVPIVLFNFDKRIPANTYYARILEPLKLHEKVENEKQLKPFVYEYQRTFAAEVEKIRRLSDEQKK
ncbi:MAG TPA: hypothetical protein DCE41_28545 [Cytophagales bacterium]|nr:hypothetical protein [Cytophagales bacterium]